MGRTSCISCWGRGEGVAPRVGDRSHLALTQNSIYTVVWCVLLNRSTRLCVAVRVAESYWNRKNVLALRECHFLQGRRSPTFSDHVDLTFGHPVPAASAVEKCHLKNEFTRQDFELKPSDPKPAACILEV